METLEKTATTLGQTFLGSVAAKIVATIEEQEIAKAATHPNEHSYLIMYELQPSVQRDVLREVLLELDAVELTRNTFGFLTNLHPDEIKECVRDVILSDCERCWIVTATSPFDGKGDDLSHTWLWAMPDYEP